MPTISLDRELAAELIRRYGLRPGDLVVEVGSGEGHFLNALRALGIRVLGIEPNMMSMARAWSDGVDTIAAHFGPGTAEYLAAKYGTAKLVIAHSVRAGSEEFGQLVAGGSRCLTPEGAIAVLATGANAVVEIRPDLAMRRAA